MGRVDVARAGRALVVALLVVVSAAWAIEAPPAFAAGAGQYSPPSVFPLRRSLNGGNITVGCTYNSPGAICGGNYHPYWALDLGAQAGTPVYAAGAGQVVAAVNPADAKCGGSTRYVAVNHNDGTWTWYWHLSAVSVANGQWVDPATKLGEVGNTGNSDCGFPHLHYERTVAGKGPATPGSPATYANSVNPGPLRACHGSSVFTYPNDAGFGSWQGIGWGTISAYSDGAGCVGAIGDGSFVVTPDGRVWRIVGGAPIYITNWTDFGGPQPTTPVADLSAFATFPADGTWLKTLPSQRVWRIIGGAPVYVSSFTGLPAPGPTYEVNDSSIDGSVGFSFGHLRQYPADGSWMSTVPSGRVWRFVGGAPLYITTFDGLPAPPGYIVQVNDASIEPATGYSLDHVRPLPLEGSWVASSPSGRVWRVIGGATVYITTFSGLPSPPNPITQVNDGSLDGTAGYSFGRLLPFPADGSWVSTAPSGRVWRFAGGAPIYVNTFSGLPSPGTVQTVNDGSLDGLAGYSFGHVRPFPADATMLQDSNGVRYKVVGGSALVIADCASPGVCSSAPVVVNPAAVTALTSYSYGHLLACPADGTLLRGLPSATNWRVQGCYRYPTASAGVAVTDGALPPLPPAPPPQPTVPTPVRNVTVAPQVGAVAVSWQAPVSDGGSAITGFSVTPKPGGATQQVGAGATSLVVAGLDAATSYTFDVVARNAIGSSAPATSSAVSPFAPPPSVTVPGAPRSVQASALTTSTARISWQAPASDGGSPVQVYRVRSQPGGAVVTVDGASTGVDVSGLSAGTAYTFAVTAVNAAGPGSATVSNSVVLPVVLGDEVANEYVAVVPERLLDTRVGVGFSGGRPGAGQTVELQVSGVGVSQVPVDARAVVLNVTGTEANGGFVTVWPCGVAMPTASNLNLVAGGTAPNLVISKVGVGGKVCLYTQAGTHLIADVAGYMPAA